MIVVGAGIGGISIALGLAEAGYPVVLVDRAPALGGLLTQLDHQFPDNRCGMCRMLPMIDRDAGRQGCLRRGVFHKNISVLISAEIQSVSGEPGRLSVLVSKVPGGIDQTCCAGCGDCEDACPVTVPDAFNAGLCERKAVYHPVPHQTESARVIDWDACTRCGACVEICPAGAIRLDPEPQTLKIEPVGMVIMATGSGLFDASGSEFYGMAEFPNVITAAGFERILSSSGPYQGRPVRPSDGKTLSRIAWIQCVGSRNPLVGADYCSRVCCMFAVKEAVLAKEKIGKGALDAAIFYMDMRTYGRDFQAYRDRAERDLGVRFIRCRIHSVEAGQAPGDLRLAYVNRDGERFVEDFDLVVLSTGQAGSQRLPDFARHEGVLVLDPNSGLRDISETVTMSQALCARVTQRAVELGIETLGEDRRLQKGQQSFPLTERPAFEIVLCRCGKRLDNKLDWGNIERRVHHLPGEVHVTRADMLCTESGRTAATRALKLSKANRLIVAGCNARMTSPLKQALERDGRFLPSMMEVVDTVSFSSARRDSPELSDTILREIEMAMNRLRSRNAPSRVGRQVRRAALVLGAGPAGLKAASVLAAHGVEVFMVERSDGLGGNVSNIQDAAVRQQIEALIDGVTRESHVKVYTGSDVVESAGSPGRFVTRVQGPPGASLTLVHGATIVATGGRAVRTRPEGWADHNRIVSVFEFERRALEGRFSKAIESVVMIQCVGSREEPRNYCSRICCLKSLKNALWIKEHYPEAQVYVFYRDIMTYGSSEAVYTSARKHGIHFVPFDLDRRPAVRVESGQVVVEGYHPILGRRLRLEPDWVCLATGVEPNPTQEVARVFGIETTAHGFLKEADSKWRPVDSTREGVFLCGLAKGPARADEALRQGAAAAHRALRILARATMSSPGVAARVRHALCSRCESCIPACPYHARCMDLQQGKVIVDPFACQACGVCVVTCPNSATVIDGFEEQGIMDAIGAAV